MFLTSSSYVDWKRPLGWVTTNVLDEDGAEWPRLLQAVMVLSSPPNLELTTLEAVGN